LIGAFRHLSGSYDYIVEKHSRLLQICHPNLYPMKVILVDNETDLNLNTLRGSSGFGSTGV
jgi:dUTPase